METNPDFEKLVNNAFREAVDEAVKPSLSHGRTIVLGVIASLIAAGIVAASVASYQRITSKELSHESISNCGAVSEREDKSN
jgi:hypothetical protein